MACYQFIQKKKKNSHRFLAKIVTHSKFCFTPFPKYFHIIKKKRSLIIGLLSTRTLAYFFYRFFMVIRKNVLEYIIALVVVKNKVRLKKCLKTFQIWQSSIVQINLSITSLRIIPKFRPVFDNQFFNFLNIFRHLIIIYVFQVYKNTQ